MTYIIKVTDKVSFAFHGSILNHEFFSSEWVTVKTLKNEQGALEDIKKIASRVDIDTWCKELPDKGAHDSRFSAELGMLIHPSYPWVGVDFSGLDFSIQY